MLLYLGNRIGDCKLWQFLKYACIDEPEFLELEVVQEGDTYGKAR